jgi:transglutaminase-like putative cysteine protease
MKKELLILFLILLPNVFAQTYYNVEEMSVDLTISNSLDIIPKSDDYILNKASVYLSFYPREDFRQEIINTNSEPKFSIDNDQYIFNWEKPTGDELTFTINSKINMKNDLLIIDKKIDFPIKNLDTELDNFLYITPTIDYNDKQVMALASQIAYGEDDLYKVVHEIGVWVNKNIEYNLNSKNVEASQSASWVIENREGVCDEITNLFIGVCRALGIPARFVSGLSYSNLDIFEENWSPHGWAEVWFPDVGWVPFDVTYGELGYIDAAHIKLKDAVDANRSSTRYEWEGYEVGIRTNKLDLKTKVISVGDQVEPYVELETKFLKDKIGFGSYNAIEVKVINLNDYYIPTEIMLSQTENIELLDDFNRYVLLKPNEERIEHWMIKLDKNLKKNYIYNFSVKAYSIRNASSKVNFISSGDFKTYSKIEIQNLIDGLTQEKIKTYSQNVDLKCTTEKIYYVGEEAEINCELHNIGNVHLSNLNVCLDDACQSVEIPIGQKSTVDFFRVLSFARHEDLTIFAKNEEVQKNTNVEFVVWDKPEIQIEELIYPNYVKLEDKFTIEFKISPKTESIPTDINVNLLSDSFEKQWTLDELKENRKYILNVDEYALSQKVNDFKILVTYSDKEGRKFSRKEEFSIILKDVGIKQQIMLLLNKFNIDIKHDMIIIASAIFFSGIMLGLIFRTKKRHTRY